MKPVLKKQRRKKGPFFRRVCNRERIYFFFLAGAFFLAAFFAGAFFLAAFFAGAFFLAVANSLTSFQVFVETTSFSFITAKRKTLCASYACTQLFSIPFFFMHSSRRERRLLKLGIRIAVHLTRQTLSGNVASFRFCEQRCRGPGLTTIAL